MPLGRPGLGRASRTACHSSECGFCCSSTRRTQQLDLCKRGLHRVRLEARGSPSRGRWEAGRPPPPPPPLPSPSPAPGARAARLLAAGHPERGGGGSGVDRGSSVKTVFAREPSDDRGSPIGCWDRKPCRPSGPPPGAERAGSVPHSVPSRGARREGSGCPRRPPVGRLGWGEDTRTPQKGPPSTSLWKDPWRGPQAAGHPRASTITRRITKKLP